MVVWWQLGPLLVAKDYRQLEVASRIAVYFIQAPLPDPLQASRQTLYSSPRARCFRDPGYGASRCFRE
jgi:hypothetical protein